jgi:hypothetical protein
MQTASCFDIHAISFLKIEQEIAAIKRVLFIIGKIGESEFLRGVCHPNARHYDNPK